MLGKPLAATFDSWIEQLIREAQAKGVFDELPGAGKPLPGLDEPYDPMWWVKRKLRDEKLSLLPDALQIRLELDRAFEARTKAELREALQGLNQRIAALNSRVTERVPPACPDQAAHEHLPPFRRSDRVSPEKGRRLHLPLAQLPLRGSHRPVPDQRAPLPARLQGQGRGRRHLGAAGRDSRNLKGTTPMATLTATCSMDMDCPKEVVVWNYYDHEHVVGTHYKYYSEFRILAERDDWCLVERFYKLPIVNLRASSLGFMFMESPNLIRSLH